MDKWLEDRLVKLQALLERPGTMGEAAAATAAFQRLMLRYNLKLEDLPKGQRSPYGIENLALFPEGTQDQHFWRIHLLHALAHFNFCRVLIYQEGSTGVVSLVGEAHNRALVKRWYLQLGSVYERLAREGYLEYRGWLTAPSPEVWERQFLDGCPIGLWDRLRAERDVDLDVEQSMALVVSKSADLDQAVSELLGGDPEIVEHVPESSHASIVGYHTGVHTSLDAPLEGQEAPGAAIAG